MVDGTPVSLFQESCFGVLAVRPGAGLADQIVAFQLVELRAGGKKLRLKALRVQLLFV